MIFGKTLSVVSFIVLTLSNVCIASDCKDYYKESTNINNGNEIILMSKNGHENDILFPKEDNDNNSKNETKSICVEFNKNGSYRVTYDGRGNNDTHDIALLPMLLNNKYIIVSSIQETTGKEKSFHDNFTPVFNDCKKIVFNSICSKCDDFDFIITNNNKNNKDELFGIVFNLLNDSKFGNIRLNNIDFFDVNTISSSTKFNCNKISSNKNSTLRIFGKNGNKHVSRIYGSPDI